MKMYLISDNIDTLTGMRLAGVEGVIVHEHDELKKALERTIADKEIGIILLTEKFGREFPDGLRQNPAEGLRLLQITRFHIEGGSIHSALPPIYRPTNSPTRRVYSSRLSRYELACDAPGTTHSSLSPGLAP